MGTRTWIPWSPQEIKLLKDSYMNMGNKDLAKLFPTREPRSIVMKLYTLGLRRKGNKPWSTVDMVNKENHRGAISQPAPYITVHKARNGIY